jgi:hypothetical protein
MCWVAVVGVFGLPKEVAAEGVRRIFSYLSGRSYADPLFLFKLDED